MPFPSTLATDDYHTLRGDQSAVPSYHAIELIAFLPNTVVFQATISTDSPVVSSAAVNSYAQISFHDVTIGAYTDILDGMTIFVGTSADIREAIFVGRIRANNSGVVSTSSTININETSAPIFAGMNVWVVNDYRVWDRLARAVTSGSTVTQYKDYELAYQLSPPFVTGLQSVYAAVCDSTDKITLSFAPGAIPITYAATISSWLWTVPSGMTITVGSTTTQNITATFDSGFSDWVIVSVTDSNGKVGVFRFWVVSVAQDYANVTVFVTGGLSFNASDNQGYSATIPAFAGVEALLDNTLMLALDVEHYNGVEASIVSNIKFTGRIRIETDTAAPDETYGVLKKTDYDLEHVTDTLARIEHLPFTLTTKASPTVWDQLTNLALPRAIAYCLWWHSTVLTLYSFTFDNFIQTWAYPILPTQGGNILSIIQDLAFSYNALLETAPTGECIIHRNALFLSASERNALMTVAHFTSVDWTNFQIAIQEVDESGKVQAAGGCYNIHSGNVVPLLSIAPGAAQGTGQNVNTFTRQVLQSDQTQAQAQVELNTRAGNQYAIVQRKQPIATVTFPPGYNFIMPEQAQWYTFTIDASDNTGGRAYTTSDRWLCQSVNVTQDNTIGTKTVSATFMLESTGFRGQTVTYPAPSSVKPALPSVPTTPSTPSIPPLPVIYMPPTPTLPDEPPYTKAAPKGDGNCVVVWSTAGLWITNNLLLTSNPTYVEITPPNALSLLTCFQWVGNGRPDGYALSNDGTDSRFHYTANVFANPPTWIDTDLTAVIYTTIRANAAAGKVYIEGVSEVSTSGCADDWDVLGDGLIIDRTDNTLTIEATLSAFSDYRIEISASGFPATPPDSDCRILTIELISGSVNSVSGWMPCGGSYPGDFVTGGYGGQCVWEKEEISSVPFTLKFTFSADDMCGDCGPHPQTNIAYSDDFGTTFASPQTLSSSLSDNVGFDTIKIGAESIVAEVGFADIATTDGGAYSNYVTMPADTAANAIWIPRYAFGSTTSGNINDTTPEVLIASGALSAGNEALWKVTASGATLTNITINDSGNYGLAVSPNCIAMPYKSGKKIAVIELFDTTRKLYVTSTSGSGWTSRGAVGDTADYVRFRKNDLLCSQIFFVDSVPKVSQDFGATIQSKASPTSDDLIGIEPYSAK